MRFSNVLLIALCCLSLVACSQDSAGPSDSWPAIADFTGDFVAVDTTGVAWNYQSMVIGANGRPQVAYEWRENSSVGARGTVKFARYDGHQWLIETVSDEQDDAGSPELLVGPDGSSILFYSVRGNAFDAELRCSRRLEEGRWESEIVDADGHVGTWSSASFDASGRLNVAYFVGYPYYDLRFATLVDGVWQKELVDSHAETGYDVQLMLGESGEIFIGYGSINPWGVRMASRNASGWTLEDVRSVVGHEFNLALDGDVPIFALRAGSFYLAVPGDPEWVLEPIDAENASGINPSGLERDSSGTLWVIYSGEVEPRIAWKRDAWESRGISHLFPNGVRNVTAIVNDPSGISILFTDADDQLGYGTIRPVFGDE
jgi:hypothetical protein